MARVLYISYDGMLEPLGESQVVACLERLAVRHQIVLMSYEKPADWADQARLAQMQTRLVRAAIEWVPLRYHKSPTVPATAYDVARGTMRALGLIRRRHIRIVHARSYVAAVIALALKRLTGVRFIFDMRGLWPDEKVAAGEWRQGGALYRAAKWCEQRFLSDADAVVSLTQAAVDTLCRLPVFRARTPRFEVIPTCVDPALFRAGSGGGSRPFTLGYLGSVGGRYQFDAVLDCFQQLRVLRPEARLRIINRGGHAAIRETLRTHGVPDECVELSAEDRAGVARALDDVDAGIFFYRAGLSTLGTAPTRLGELLASGIPCLANAGVGDVEQVLEGEGVGVVLRDFTVEAEARAVRRLTELAEQPQVRHRCTDVAQRMFSLEQAANRYDRLYRSLNDARA